MKKLFIIAAFFWACTFTQQAQHIPSLYTQLGDKSGLSLSDNFQPQPKENGMLIAENNLNNPYTTFSLKIKTF